MNRRIVLKYRLLLLLLLFVFSSCQKADDNGDLGGFWKLMEVEYAAGGEKRNLKDNNYFMAVQLDLMQFRGEAGSCYARFSHQGDSLFVWMIGDDVPSSLLEAYAMNGAEQRFFVETLNGKKLILRSDFSRLRFKKF